ncbi:MAG: LPS biosynthesis protein WbpP [Candidatus Omnitrophica bacterium CG07_land_8_20_14_0_80_42_15]|uniref:LPS biosynthesis protein WbpP n=1 Tax=Candidatus Aquitaenariimonas noxiae TaxID=1974741 RepID=A0A2J0KXB4_9BACT|nr:MAG: LPS biosynthesis protein WbpP [Candidatus Omnitrophica bacterium CG07_land_8_20_14_0_80_42_15]
MAKYLVTGGAGFIGSNIVEELIKRGEKVRVIDNFSTGRKENLNFALGDNVTKSQRHQQKPSGDLVTWCSGDFELIEGDIRDEAVVKRAVKGMDIVLHQAAFRSVAKSVEEPALTVDVNILGTLNILMASWKEGVKRVVCASSSSVYGETEKFPQKESDPPSPISPYAASKLSGEHYCKVFSETYGIETVCLRYFNVFGPRQNPESKYSTVIPAFIAWMLKDEPPKVDSDGKQSRDFTYVSNVVNANLSAAAIPNLKWDVINIACGETHSVLDIVSVLNKILGKNIKPTFWPKRKGDVRCTIADITKMKKVLGLSAQVGFEEGIRKTVEWFKSHPEAIKLI